MSGMDGLIKFGQEYMAVIKQVSGQLWEDLPRAVELRTRLCASGIVRHPVTGQRLHIRVVVEPLKRKPASRF